MRLRDLHENGGKIVKGVNTTVDVGLDQIAKEASKWGWAVDRGGRPAHVYSAKNRLNPHPTYLPAPIKPQA